MKKRRGLVVVWAALLVFLCGMLTCYAAPSGSTTCDHDWVTVNAVSATSTTNGNIEYEKCSKCGQIRWQGVEVSLDYCIIPAENSDGQYDSSEISSVEFEPSSAEPYEQMEEDGNYYSFYFYRFNDGDTLKVNLKNGTAATYKFVRNSYCGDYSHFYNVDDPDDVIGYGNGFEGLWESVQIQAGDTADITLKYKGASFTVKLKIIQNPIKSVSYKVSGDGVIHIEEYDENCGRWEEDGSGNKFFFYQNIPYQNGDVLTLEYADGSTKDFIYDDSEKVFKSTDGDTLDYIDCQTSQYFDHWYSGNTYYISFGYNRRFTGDVIPVEIDAAYKTGEYKLLPKSIDTDLEMRESIDVTPEVRTASTDPAKAYDVVSNVTYEWTYDSNDLEITEDNSGASPKYTITRKSAQKTSLTLTAKWDTSNSVSLTYNLNSVTQKHNLERVAATDPTNTANGNIEYWRCTDCGKMFMNSGGEEELENIQNILIPALESDGKYDAGDISSVELEPATGLPYEQIEEDENYYSFYFYRFNDGDVLKVNLKSGTTVSYQFVESRYCGDYSHFYNVDDPDDVIGYGNGFEGIWDNVQIQVGETKDITLKYKGASFTVKLKVVQNPIKSVSYKVSGDGVIHIKENDENCGYWEEDYSGNKFFVYFVPHQNGDVLTLEYADGSTKDFTYDDSEKAFKSTDGDTLQNIDCQTAQYSYHWYYGNTYYCTFGFNRRYTDEIIPVKIEPVYTAGEYKVFPSTVDLETPVGDTFDFTPEIRTASTDPAKAYDVVSNVTYDWTYDSDNLKITEDTTGASPKFTIRRRSEDRTSFTLTASWGGGNSLSRTYQLNYVECQHNMTQTPEKAATCTEDGNIEYWTCSNCEKLFSYEKGCHEISLADTVVAATGHAYGNLIAEVPASCTEDGVKAHYECSTCHKLFDENKNEVTATDLVIKATGHAYGNLIAEKPASCTENGVKAHYECSTCNKLFDENKNEVTAADLAIAKLGHTWGKATYVWSDDNTQVTATHTCSNPEHTGDNPVSETVSASGKVVAEPTATTEGEMRYTSDQFTGEGFEVQTKTVPIPSLTDDALTKAAAAASEAAGAVSNVSASSSEADVTAAESAAQNAANLAAAAEAAANENLTQAQDAVKKAENASDEEKQAAQANLNVAVTKLATAKKLTAAANASLASAKKSAAAVAAAKAAAANEAAKKAETAAEAEEYRQQAEAAAQEASQKSQAAETASKTASEASAALADLVNTADESVKETIEQDSKEASEASTQASEAAGDASKSSEAAESSKNEAKETADEKAAEEEKAKDPCANGHSYGPWTTTKAATEVSTGVKTRECSGCGKKETQTIAMRSPTLKAVKISKPKAAKKSATIKWKKVSKKNLKKIKKIEIQYSLDKSFKTGVKTKYAKAKKKSLKIKGLKKGKRYYVRIRAYTKSGSTVHVSKWSAVKNVKAK